MTFLRLTDLIFPVSDGDFFRDYWEKKLLHVQRDQDDYFSKILSVSDIDVFLSQQNLPPECMLLMTRGEHIPEAKWTTRETLLNGTVKRVVNPQKVFKLFGSGATIIINSAEKCIPCLTEACRAFEQDLRIRVQANIYITPARSQGFAMHYDPHDIFLLQIKGRKNWNIYDSGEMLPVTYRAFRKEPRLVSSIVVNPGDLIYMPRGTVHEAFSSDDTSIHVNFSCKARYGYHLLEELAGFAEQREVFFRHTIPHGYSSNKEKEQYAATFRQKLQELLRTIPVEELLEKEKENFAAGQLMSLRGIFTGYLECEKLNLQSTVSRRKGFSVHAKNNGKQLEIIFGEKRISVPGIIEPQLFLQDTAFRIGDIKGLVTDNGRLALVREMIEAGYLQIDNI
jgi:ribosomal protein L16 Arg81 hydroxylase